MNELHRPRAERDIAEPGSGRLRAVPVRLDIALARLFSARVPAVPASPPSTAGRR